MSFLVLIYIVISILIQEADGLQDSFTTGTVDRGYLNDAKNLYPQSFLSSQHTESPMSIGEARLVYLRILKSDTSQVNKSVETFTAVYFPKVDDYSIMTIPGCKTLRLSHFNSLFTDKYQSTIFTDNVKCIDSFFSNKAWGLLQTDTNPHTSTNLSLIMYYNAKPLYLPLKRWNARNFGLNYYVNGRTALVTLNQGESPSFLPKKGRKVFI